MATTSTRWVDAKGEIRYGLRPPPPQQENRKWLWSGLILCFAFIAWKVYATRAIDPCSLPESDYISIFRGSQFIRDHSDQAPIFELRQPGVDDEDRDFGGKYGCIPEPVADSMELETTRVTRCSTTVCALSRFFCGEGSEKSTDYRFGFDSLKDHIKRERPRGAQKTRFYRAVLSSVAAKSNDHSTKHTGLNHVWMIVALQDGTFYWLQSFIMKYSLYTWLKREGNYHLTKDELFRRLDNVERLTKARTWDAISEGYYAELFNVSMSDYWTMSDLDNSFQLKARTERFDPQQDALITIWQQVCDLGVVCKERAPKRKN